MGFFDLGKSKRRKDLVDIINQIKKHRSVNRQKDPKTYILDLCERLIEKEWMYLDEPREFANTIVNIYYSYCELTILMMKVKNREMSYQEMFKELGLDGMKFDFIEYTTKILPTYQAHVLGDFKTINEMINSSRQIQAEYGKDSDVYKSTVAFAIAVMKYDIDAKDAFYGRKNAITRQLEDSIVDEIPDLIDFINLYE